MIIHITISSIANRLSDDGDLRNGEYDICECDESDDVGYYQQASQLLLTSLNESVKRENLFYDLLMEYADHAEASNWYNLSSEIRRRTREIIQ